MRFAAAGRIQDVAAFSKVVGAREMNCATFIRAGVVVPHGRGGVVRRLSLAVGLSSAGIRWGGDSRRAANAVSLFAIPLSQAAVYLALLSALPGLIHDEGNFAMLKAARQAKHFRPRPCASIAPWGATAGTGQIERGIGHVTSA